MHTHTVFRSIPLPTVKLAQILRSFANRPVLSRRLQRRAISLSAFNVARDVPMPYWLALVEMRRVRGAENLRRCRAFRPLKSELNGHSKRCAECGELEPAH